MTFHIISLFAQISRQRLMSSLGTSLSLMLLMTQYNNCSRVQFNTDVSGASKIEVEGGPDSPIIPQIDPTTTSTTSTSTSTTMTTSTTTSTTLIGPPSTTSSTSTSTSTSSTTTSTTSTTTTTLAPEDPIHLLSCRNRFSLPNIDQAIVPWTFPIDPSKMINGDSSGTYQHQQNVNIDPTLGDINLRGADYIGTLSASNIYGGMTIGPNIHSLTVRNRTGGAGISAVYIESLVNSVGGQNISAYEIKNMEQIVGGQNITANSLIRYTDGEGSASIRAFEIGSFSNMNSTPTSYKNHLICIHTHQAETLSNLSGLIFVGNMNADVYPNIFSYPETPVPQAERARIGSIDGVPSGQLVVMNSTVGSIRNIAGYLYLENVTVNNVENVKHVIMYNSQITNQSGVLKTTVLDQPLQNYPELYQLPAGYSY